MTKRFLDILSKNQLQSTSILGILYFFLKIPVLSCFVGTSYQMYSYIWWHLAILCGTQKIEISTISRDGVPLNRGTSYFPFPLLEGDWTRTSKSPEGQEVGGRGVCVCVCGGGRGQGDEGEGSWKCQLQSSYYAPLHLTPFGVDVEEGQLH